MSRYKFGNSVYPYLNLLFICLLFNAVFFLLSGKLAQSQLMENINTPPVVSVPPDTLWDQTANISSANISSQDFTDGAGFDQFDSRAADDFLVPGGLFWIIDKVRVFGAFDDATPDLVDSLSVFFFTDGGGLPGSLVPGCTYLNILPENVTVPNFVIDLPNPCVLGSGTYWISVQANIKFITNGQWFWHENSVQTLDPFVWENPGNGFSTGCIAFTPAQANCDADQPDLSFQLTGRETDARCGINICKSAPEILVPPNGGEELFFTFEVSQDGESDSFDVVANGPCFGDAFDGSNFEITEDVPGGWTLESVECSDSDFVDVTPIENGLSLDCLGLTEITCTFSNVRGPSPIPALSEWGMAAAAVILGFAGLGAFYLRRKCSQA